MRTSHKSVGTRVGEDHAREMGYWQAVEDLSDEELVANMVYERQRLFRPERPENYYLTELDWRRVCLTVLEENLRLARLRITDEAWGYIDSGEF